MKTFLFWMYPIFRGQQKMINVPYFSWTEGVFCFFKVGTLILFVYYMLFFRKHTVILIAVLDHNSEIWWILCVLILPFFFLCLCPTVYIISCRFTHWYTCSVTCIYTHCFIPNIDTLLSGYFYLFTPHFCSVYVNKASTL